jgi:hypothetical protein
VYRKNLFNKPETEVPSDLPTTDGKPISQKNIIVNMMNNEIGENT